MTNGELITILSRMIITTSDDCANRLYNVFNKMGKAQTDVALKEYIYLKMYIAAQLCYQASGAPGDSDYLVKQSKENVKDTLRKTGASFNYGATPEELEERFLYYNQAAPKGDLSSIATAFINVLDPVFILMLHTADNPQSVFEEFVQCAITDMRSRLIKKTSGGGDCYIATAIYDSYDCPEVFMMNLTGIKYGQYINALEAQINRMPKILRWIIMLPISMICSYLFYFLSMLLVNIIWSGVLGLDKKGSLYMTLESICGGPLIIAGLLGTAYLFAPKYKSYVVFLLSLFVLVATIISFWISTYSLFDKVGESIILSLIVAIYGCVLAWRKLI